MTWLFIICITIAVVVGGCTVVMGSGRANVIVERKVEVGSENEASMSREVEAKDKK